MGGLGKLGWKKKQNQSSPGAFQQVPGNSQYVHGKQPPHGQRTLLADRPEHSMSSWKVGGSHTICVAVGSSRSTKQPFLCGRRQEKSVGNLTAAEPSPLQLSPKMPSRTRTKTASAASLRNKAPTLSRCVQITVT